MAVKGKKCQDIKSMDWISSSFSDSFGLSVCNDNENHDSSSGKRAKLYEENTFDVSRLDLISSENDFKLGRSNKKVLKSSSVWCEKYKPKNIDELVINKKKILELENWLKSAFVGDSRYKQNKILILTGSTGSGKTCSLNVVCKSLGIGINEWVTPMDITYNYVDNGYDNDSVLYQRSITKLFDEFILQSSKYTSVLSLGNNRSDKKIVLVKDFPNIFLNKPEIFHEMLDKFNNSCNSGYHISPLVFILSCPNAIRDLFSDEVKFKFNIATVNFNPVTETNVIKTLNRILSLESKLCSSKFKMPSKDDLISISDSSDGDLRSAILKLQFNLDNSYNDEYIKSFKVPKPLSNNRERIRVKKSSSLRHKVCEIDKDKKLDFFNSIGRVLYPKKEVIGAKSDSISKSNYKFVHSPDSIAETFFTEPNKFINMLHENYLSRFTNIKDVSMAASCLSLSDFLLSSSWEGKDIMVRYSLSTVVRTLMTSNSKPAPNSWKPMSKSKIWVSENNRKENLRAVRCIFPDMQSEKDVLLDVIPFIKKLKLNLTPDQDDIISRICHYKLLR